MIIARSPLRVTLGGGGTDLPSYYEKFGGFLIAAAIDKYVYITLHDTFVPDLIVKYSELERVPEANQLEASHHPRSVRPPRHRRPFAGTHVHGGHPRRHGARLLRQFHDRVAQGAARAQKNLVHPAELAAQACEIELGRLKEPIGKQDQYIAAYGGITCFKFLPDGKVEAWPLKVSDETRDNLEDNLLLFFTGYSRNASAILKEQDQKSKSNDQAMIENLHFIKDLGLQSQKALESGDLPEFARLMDVHWQRKKQRSGGMSNPKINEWYDLAHGQRRARRQTHRRGRRRLSDVLRRGKNEVAPRDAQAGLAGSALPLRFRGNQTRDLVSAPLEIPVAILAGGLATRLRPITEKIPKSLVPVAGKPFLAHQLELLHSRGIRHAVLCVGHLGEMIQRDFGNEAFGIKLDYSFDGPKLLGTGGAIKRALPMLGEEFFVLYGDSYLPIEYRARRGFFSSAAASSVA